MSEDTVKLLVIVLALLVIIYVSVRFMKGQMLEGLENRDTTTDGTSLPETNFNGEAGNSANYATKIKSVVTKMHDTFLIDKYRKDYENVIINMDDLLDCLMMKVVLNIQIDPDNPSGALKHLALLNSLNESKNSLNNVMKFVDKN